MCPRALRDEVLEPAAMRCDLRMICQIFAPIRRAYRYFMWHIICNVVPGTPFIPKGQGKTRGAKTLRRSFYSYINRATAMNIYFCGLDHAIALSVRPKIPQKTTY